MCNRATNDARAVFIHRHITNSPEIKVKETRSTSDPSNNEMKILH